MRTDYIPEPELELVLALLTPTNRLVCQVALHTGLRISDVLSLRTEQLKPRITIREQKTGKSRRISIPTHLLEALRAQAGPVWVFTGRSGSHSGHRTRQAVWADVKRAARAARLPINAAPHSLRKNFAVRDYQRTGDLAHTQQMLNHEDQITTLIYAMADKLAAQRGPQSPRRRSRPR
jgi:integrase